jgi:hypothetical protein
MKTFIICLLALSAAIIISCEKDDSNIIKKERLSGFAQKGPFNNGTSVTISELDKNLTQTGKTFSTQIIDNKGTFEIDNVEFSSSFVELKADGFYFDEVANENSSARLVLYALTDLTDSSSINVNILSNLEKERVEYLISGGSSFSEAKSQAQQEILSIFNITRSDMPSSEYLDITKQGEDNAILLAVSSIVKGYRTVAELSELLANISTDIREDGVLNSSSTGTALINHARYLNTGNIRTNLTGRYETMGVSIEIPDFEKYVKQFVDNTDFAFTGFIEYPETSPYGINILNDKDSVFTIGVMDTYSMAAVLPKGASLKIKLEFVEGGERVGSYWAFEAAPNGPINWKNNIYDFENNTQIFEVMESGTIADLEIMFLATADSKIRINYYENNPDTVTKSRIIKIVAGE